MGISDAFKGLFPSNADRAKELRRRQRRAFAKAESAIDTVNDHINEMNQEKIKAWNEAKRLAASGQKAMAMMSLQKFRALEVQVFQQEKRKWVFQNYISRLKLQDVNNEFAEAMTALNDVIQVDVDAVVDAVEDIDDKLLDVSALDKMWEKSFEKNLNGMNLKDTDIIPDVDSLFASLQGEVALDIGGGTNPVTQTAKPSLNDVEAKLNAMESSEK